MKIYFLLALLIFTSGAYAGTIGKSKSAPRLNEKEKKFVDAIVSQKATEEYSFIDIDKSVFNENRINVWLLSWNCDFIVQSKTRNHNGSTTIVAKPVGKEGYALFTIKGNSVYGNILIATQFYDIYVVGDNKYILRKYDQKQYPNENCAFEKYKTLTDQASSFGPTQDNAHHNAYRDGDDGGGGSDGGSGGTREPEVHDVCELKIAVFYNIEVESLLSDPQTFAQNCIDVVNLTFANSNIFHTAILAYAGSSKGLDKGEIDRDMLAFANPSDGDMDDIHTIRDFTSADLCVLLSTDTKNAHGDPVAGVADMIFADKSHAFAAVTWTAAIANFSFPHEVGHLLGARHDVGSSTPFADGHGLTDISHGFRTVMALDNAGCCVRIPYFSNPSVTFSGFPTGTTTFANNARVLNQTIVDARCFRQPPSLVALSFYSFPPDIFADVEAVDKVLSNYLQINNFSNFYIRAGGEIDFLTGVQSAAYMQAEIANVYHCSGDPNAGGVKNGGDLFELKDEFEGNDLGRKSSIASVADGIDKLTIYPNPASTQLNLTWRSENQEKLSVSVIDVNGKVVYYWSALPGTNTYDVSELASGFYMIRAVLPNGKVLNDHFIKEGK